MLNFSPFRILVLTFVLCFWTSGWAKPKVTVSPRASDRTSETTKEQDLKALEDFGITRVVPTDPRQIPAEIYPFKQNIHLAIGIGDELSKLSKIKEPFLLGTYTLPSRYTPRYEINLGMLGKDIGFGGARWKYEWSERSYFRPFVAAGVAISFADNDGLATFVQIKNYGVPLGFGFEKNFTKRQSYRVELYNFLGFEKSFAALSVGLTTAW